MEQKNELLKYIQSISLFLLGILLMVFPIVFTSATTNPIVFPKQALLGGITFILIILQAVKIISEKSVKLRRTSFDIPLILLALFALLSAVFAVNRADALTAFVPYLFGISAFFFIVNIARDKNSLLFLMFSVMIGAMLLSVSSVLSFFKIYILPFPGTHIQTFTPLGSLLEQSIYLGLIFCMSFYYLWRFLKHKRVKEEAASSSEKLNKLHFSGSETIKAVSFGVGSFIVVLGFIITIYSLFRLNKPFILPLETGFQTAFSEISLDSGRIGQGFLLGSGIGTYSTDFSRWKQASFNQNQSLWNLTFFRSSSFALELLATTGVLGLCSFIFLTIRAIKEIRLTPQNKMFLSLIVLLIISLIMPLGFTTQTLFFIILGLFAANQGSLTKNQGRFFDIEFHLVTLKKGLIAMEAPHEKNEKSLVLSSITTALLLIVVAVIGYYSITYLIADLTFQKSLVTASKNNGSLTYQEQAKAISIFPYRDGFYRVFSQTNLALANSLASQLPKGASPSAQIQQNINTLIQQSLNSARAATTIAPQTNLNWQNLSSIYKALIGFGQNAENFAIATVQQSINLNPNNPQEYINLGGIYYQLEKWDNAQTQFHIAISLKPDYANSHYNLGHTLEQKGDTQGALAQYQAVATLVANDKTSLNQINKEIEALRNKTETGSKSTGDLNLNTPEVKLPPQNPQVKIPAPDAATKSSR